MVGRTGLERERILIAMDWYNQTFQRIPVIDERGKIIEISIAFEVLLNLPSENISGTFCSCVEILLGSSIELNAWAKRFYDARSKIVHKGKPLTLLYKHPEASTEHLSLLFAAKKIFVWCLDTMLGEPRGMHIDDITWLFATNEVYLKHLKQVNSYEKLKQKDFLKEVSLLRPSYPVGDKKDIINLGKLLLGSYKDLYMTTDHKPLPTLERILNFQDKDPKNLGLLYYEFNKEFEPIYFRYISSAEGASTREQLNQKKPEPITDVERMSLENALFQFSYFAGFAL